MKQKNFLELKSTTVYYNARSELMAADDNYNKD